jgi:hypothetical protein
LLLVVAALPWIVFHHIVNYQIGGSLAPANANPAFFDWPGSPFSEQNMTGGWNHANPLKAAVYALAMLFGKKGFLGHNLILFVPLIGLPWLLRRRVPEYRVILIGLIWAIGTWLLYASTSTNSSGGCCSVRWFVPLLAPAFVALCVLLRDHPAFRFDAVIAGSGGVLLGIGMAIRGPWFHKLMPFYFVIYFGTLMVWIATRWLMRTRPIALRQDITILSLRITGSTPLTLYSNRVWPNPDPVAANNRHFTLEVPGHRIHQALREDAIIPEAETTEQQAQSPHAESAARPTADTSRPAEPKPAETKPAAQKSGEEDEWLGFDLKFDNQPDLDLGKEK